MAASSRAASSSATPTNARAPRASPIAASARAPPADGPAPSVVLTREAGKNGKLAAALAQRGVPSLELPMVRTAGGPDQRALPSALAPGPDAPRADWEWVVITSPEAASVFVDGWRVAGRPPARVAVVGAGTARALLEVEGGRKGGGMLKVDFTPTIANAVTLAAELPLLPGGSRRILYPASAKAGGALAEGLAERGFVVTRLDTYTTLPVPPGDHPASALAAAAAAPVVALASPCAAKAWAAAVGGEGVARGAAACIGSTTAVAARALGFRSVHYPEAPGLVGFVEAVVEALDGVGVAV